MKASICARSALVISGLFLLACDGDADVARAELAKAEQACAQGEPDRARDIMSKAAADNEAFGDAWSFATSGMADKQHIKPCGPVLQQLKTRLGE